MDRVSISNTENKPLQPSMPLPSTQAASQQAMTPRNHGTWIPSPIVGTGSFAGKLGETLFRGLQAS